MGFEPEQPVYHCAECWVCKENKHIVASSLFPQHNLDCDCSYHTTGCVTGDWNMSEYSNDWPDLAHPSVKLQLSPQTDPIRESPELNEASQSCLPTNTGRANGTATIFDPLQMDIFGLAMPDSVINFPDPFSYHLDLPQDLSGSDVQYFSASMQPGPWFEENTSRELIFSEPESLDTSTEPDDQKCLDSIRKPIQTVSCRQPDCDKTFRKKTDMDRHFESIHEGAGFICGDCENEGIPSPPKRKDHFLPHLYKHPASKATTWECCRKCPWPLCEPENPKQSRLFSTQNSLKRHLRLRHNGEIPGSFQQTETDIFALLGDQDPESSLKGTKRPQDQERHGVKKARYGDCAFDAQPAFFLHGQEEEPFTEASDTLYSEKSHENIDAKYPASSTLAFQIIQSEPNATMEEYEIIMFNVTPVDYLALLSISGEKLKTLDRAFLPANSTNSEKHKTPVVSFNTSQRSILLRGPRYIVNFCKSFLERDLDAIRSSRPLIYLNNSSTKRRLDPNDHLRTDFKIPAEPRRSVRNSNKVFTVRKDEDAYLIDLWMKKILPSLFKILDESIGNEYSASLVREGSSEQSAIAVVRIESPQIPTSTTREDILQQLDKSCGIILAESGIEVRFSAGSLMLLAGKRSRRNIANTDDKRELPFHTRYWKYPGMGASIGLLCTEEEFATLGCYVEVDKQTYIMTINHLIEKSYRKLESGVEDKHTLTSPALAKVKTMRKDIGHLLSTLEGDMAAEFRKFFKDQELPITDRINLPKEMLEIRRKQIFVSEFASELKRDKKDFKIGSLAHQCKSDGTAPLCTEHSNVASDLSVYSALDLQPAEMCHRMDWALFKSDTRTGANRHRYRYNPADGTTDYFPVEKDHGEGDICQETCIVESNEKVYFVGQTSGRLTGEINATLRVVNYQGRKTLEHHIVMAAEQKKTGKDYAGDSGAVILRISDDKLVGQVWGCYNNEVVFTPIRTVFADIKATLQAGFVDLPKVGEDATPNDVLLISGTESEVEKQRPFKSSDLVLPPLKKEEADKESQLLAASILESFKRKSWIGTDFAKSTAKNDKCTSPVPSLSSSRSPSPLSMPPSPSPGYRNLATVTDTAKDSLVLISEENFSFRTRESSQDCTSDDEDGEGYFVVQDLSMVSKLPVTHLFDQTRKDPVRYCSYPGIRPARLLRSVGTWPINASEGWDSVTKR